eukprot:gnl/MRDRNA2_/MRDRNA2_74386_c0_seq1.p1 gnl/MRDRNA2_/MRDRNA2_74386_c0~~gnl/MRDRNA2_/MRDRNA2_74386_c0_seq1.p1  ORF type:complete len:575 (+),score=166.53 gnl/MRDRNA2_/MRDRNA2_74386_c0_seq1:60-1784(+)
MGTEGNEQRNAVKKPKFFKKVDNLRSWRQQMKADRKKKNMEWRSARGAQSREDPEFRSKRKDKNVDKTKQSVAGTLEEPAKAAPGKEKKKQKNQEQTEESSAVAKKKKKNRQAQNAEEDNEGEVSGISKQIKRKHEDVKLDGDSGKEKRKRLMTQETGGTVEVFEAENQDGHIKPDTEAYKVVVAGIPERVDEKILRRDFGDCGEVLNVRLLKDRETGRSRGIAFISFTNQAAMDAALEYNGDDYGGRSLVVQVADKSSAKGTRKGSGKGKVTSQSSGVKPEGCTSVVLKNLAYKVTKADLTQVFESCGEGAKNVNMLKDPKTGMFKGIAFIDFDSETAVDAAMKFNGTELHGRRFTMDYAEPREKKDAPGEKPAGCTSVIVKGLEFSVTEAALRKVFKSCGDGPTNVRFAIDQKTGISRGLAWVDFDSEASVDEAIKLHGSELNGRRFKVDFAAPADQGGNENGESVIHPKKQKEKGLGRKPEGCTSVTVKGLAASLSEAKVMKVFKSCGSGPRSVNIVKDKETGESTGMAFVNFWSVDAVDEAMKFHGMEWKGNTLSMGYVKPKAPKPKEKK